MSTQNLITSLTIVFLLSLVGASLWLYEIVAIKGWYGLNWLTSELYSPYFATFIAVFAFMSPFIMSKKVSIGKLFIVIITLYIVSLFCFKEAENLFREVFSRFYFLIQNQISTKIIIALILFPIIGFSYWFITNKLIKKVRKINILIISVLTLTTIPLSLLTIKLNTGFGTGIDWIDCVKMGYPVFWITSLLGISGIIMARQNNITTVQV